MLAATFGVGQVAYSILWFFLIFIEIWLMISIFIDIFRSHDLKGWAKAAWVILVLVFPIIGILAYLIIRGDKMRAHQIETLQLQDQMFRAYLRRAVTDNHSVSEELATLAQLHRDGELTDAEYELLKGQILAEAREGTVANGEVAGRVTTA